MRREPPVRLMRRTGTCTRHFKVIVELEKKEEKNEREKGKRGNFKFFVMHSKCTAYSI